MCIYMYIHTYRYVYICHTCYMYPDTHSIQTQTGFVVRPTDLNSAV